MTERYLDVSKSATKSNHSREEGKRITDVIVLKLLFDRALDLYIDGFPKDDPLVWLGLLLKIS